MSWRKNNNNIPSKQAGALYIWWVHNAQNKWGNNTVPFILDDVMEFFQDCEDKHQQQRHSSSHNGASRKHTKLLTPVGRSSGTTQMVGPRVKEGDKHLVGVIKVEQGSRNRWTRSFKKFQEVRLVGREGGKGQRPKKNRIMDKEKRVGMRKRLIEKMGRVGSSIKTQAITRAAQCLSSCHPLKRDWHKTVL